MKKSIVLATIGLAMTVASSRGQGFVQFSSYAANGGAGATTSFWFPLMPGLVGTGYTADLYYAIGTVSDPVNSASILSMLSPPTGLTDLGVSAAYDNSGGATGVEGLGYFDGGVVTIPGYTGGPITFEVVAYQTSYGSYNNSINRGRSGSFTMSSIATRPVPVPGLGDNGQPMPDFYVIAMPEPTTSVLTALGGLVSLAVFRRKRD
jgi:hypothetical protein